MNNTSQIILNILIKILGAPKKESINLKEYEFNCKSKICRHDEKYNLAYNSKNNIFHCWKCKYSGTAHRIAEDYGNKDDLERISSVLPKKNYIKNNQKTKEYNELIVCQLPEGFNPLTKKSDSKYYKSAVMYITGKKKGQRALH